MPKILIIDLTFGELIKLTSAYPVKILCKIKYMNT